jgi:hypothetical protein
MWVTVSIVTDLANGRVKLTIATAREPTARRTAISGGGVAIITLLTDRLLNHSVSTLRKDAAVPTEVVIKAIPIITGLG